MMARMVLLDTRTVNFLELIGNGKIYRVPPYQRDYSWKEEHWDDLWKDILDLRDKPDDRHYMGALVVEGKSDREFLIIDGQQRMATLSILALAVIARLRKLAAQNTDTEANQERAAGLRNRFIGEKDPASLIESSKLFLNETDNGFYQDYLVQLRVPHNTRGLNNSNRLLWQCFQWFSKQLDSLPADGATLATLLSETVARQLLFILIKVDDDLNAYTIFETLNARGLELSSTDLLKNYLFSKIKVSADMEVLQRRWRGLMTIVKQERFPEFLRYHLLCDYPQIRTQRLFKLVRDQIKTPAAVFDLLCELEARAELFTALGDVGHEYWIDYPECKPYIRELTVFKVRQMMPLLFAVWEKFDHPEFARVLKQVSIIAFRYTVVSSLNTNDLEPVYHRAAKAVLNGTAATAAAVFEQLRPIYVDDAKFRQNFAALELATSGQRKQLVKYILCRLESDLTHKVCDFETDPATIEHILPENPEPSWETVFSRTRQDRYIYRLGNLTLLEASRNRRLGNADYAEQCALYRDSAYALTRQLVELAPEEWTPALLDARQQRLADRAMHVWRADFA